MLASKAFGSLGRESIARLVAIAGLGESRQSPASGRSGDVIDGIADAGVVVVPAHLGLHSFVQQLQRWGDRPDARPGNYQPVLLCSAESGHCDRGPGAFALGVRCLLHPCVARLGIEISARPFSQAARSLWYLAFDAPGGGLGQPVIALTWPRFLARRPHRQ